MSAMVRHLNVVELHPEELLDTEARGALTAAEAVVLDAHCARCSVCRYERIVRGEFGAMLAGPDEEPSALENITKARENAPIASEGDRESGHVYSPSPGAPREAWWFGRRVIAWMSVAGMLVVGSHFVGASADANANASANGLAAESAKSAHVVASAKLGIDTSSARERVTTIKAAPLARPRVIVASAASMFDDANRARVHGDYQRAHDRYERLQRMYPTSREANLSFVTMGRMQLDRADASGALASLERYEEGRDLELDAVAMACRALALDELGSESAPLAWAALLGTHPDTPYAQHARLRAGAVLASNTRSM